MNDETKQMYIANCKTCTLADAMKTCSRCLFNIGLDARQHELFARVLSRKYVKADAVAVTERDCQVLQYTAYTQKPLAAFDVEKLNKEIELFVTEEIDPAKSNIEFGSEAWFAGIPEEGF